MKLCLNKNPQLKWILLTILLAILIYESLPEEEGELLGGLLTLAGDVMTVLGISSK